MPGAAVVKVTNQVAPPGDWVEPRASTKAYRTLVCRVDTDGNEAAGRKFAAMLAKGASQPWQDTLYELTGTRQMDGSALIEYFKPLQDWLREQNKGETCGW